MAKVEDLDVNLNGGVTGSAINENGEKNTPPEPEKKPSKGDTSTDEEKEILHEGDITVSISNSSPIIVLFGARTSGKTMTLVRLTRYLLKNGYSVEPDMIFRTSQSAHYKKQCKSFLENVNSNKAADVTGNISFMLLEIRKAGGGPMVCQILEAPGEHFFDPNLDKDTGFPPYITTICNSKNMKVWMFMVEVDWGKDATIRTKYAEKIAMMRNLINPQDKIILMCHKADKQSHKLYYQNMPNKKQFYEKIRSQYGQIFASNKNTNPIKRFFSPFNMDFVIFSAGQFHDATDGNQTYTESNDIYPATLWKAILKNIKGRWI